MQPQNTTGTALERLDALFNGMIVGAGMIVGPTTDAEMRRVWTLKIDFKRAIQHLSDVEIERAAARLLHELTSEVA